MVRNRRKNALQKIAVIGIALGFGMFSAVEGSANDLNMLFTAEEAVDRTIGVVPDRIDIEMFNGTVEIESTTDKAITAHIIKRGSGSSQSEAREDIKNIAVEVTGNADFLRIAARRIDKRLDRSNSGAAIKLRVPSGIILDLHTRNGEIISTGPSGEITADTSNEKIEVKGAQGRLTLETSNAPIIVQGGIGTLNLKTSNDNIEISADQVTVSAATGNGAIRYAGVLRPGRHQFSSENGEISLRLPADTNFRVDAETRNAGVNTDFQVTAVDAGEDESVLQGFTGSHPNVFLKIRTSNSDIHILKANGGK